MQSNIQLWPATAGDLPFLTDCFLRSMRDTIVACRGGWDEEDNRSKFDSQLDIAATNLIQANQGERVGFLTAIESAVEIHLHTLCVSPEYQRKGIGTHITHQLIENGRASRRDIVLDVMRVNDGARRLYERLGFVIIQEHRHHVRMRFFV